MKFFNHCTSAREPFHLKSGVRASASMSIESIVFDLVLTLLCPMTSILEKEFHSADKCLLMEGLERYEFNPLFSPGGIASTLKLKLAPSKSADPERKMIPYTIKFFSTLCIGGNSFDARERSRPAVICG